MFGKIQQLQKLAQSNVDTRSLNNAKRAVTRHFRKKEQYLKAKIVELETDIKTKNIRDLYGGNNEFKRVTSLELI